MAALFNYKRVKFSRGKQREFLLKAKNVLRVPYKEVAEMLNVCQRTLMDWRREKFLISLEAVNVLTKKTGLKPDCRIKILDKFWYVKKAAVLGGKALYKKYGRVGGDPKIRKKKWFEWWTQKGRFNPSWILKSLEVKGPKKSENLAELFGIILGDGGLTKYQLVITLHHIDDKKYSLFVIRLIEKLFKLRPKVYHNVKNSVLNIVASRKELIDFLLELGLKTGNKIKQQVDIPTWIKQNKKFKVACLRGLIDTDGSVFNHKYQVNGKWYSYKKINFCSASKPLLRSAFGILEENGLKPRIYGNNIKLENSKHVFNYFRLIKSHNPKHLMRYKK